MALVIACVVQSALVSARALFGCFGHWSRVGVFNFCVCNTLITYRHAVAQPARCQELLTRHVTGPLALRDYASCMASPRRAVSKHLRLSGDSRLLLVNLAPLDYSIIPSPLIRFTDELFLCSHPIFSRKFVTVVRRTASA